MGKTLSSWPYGTEKVIITRFTIDPTEILNVSDNIFNRCPKLRPLRLCYRSFHFHIILGINWRDLQTCLRKLRISRLLNCNFRCFTSPGKAVMIVSEDREIDRM